MTVVVAPDTSISRLAVVCDYREEGWHSMDLVADMLLEGLRERHATRFAPTAIRPMLPFRVRQPGVPEGTTHIAERLAGRFLHYPRVLRAAAAQFDLFHVCDHSYAHLALNLPAGRVGVYCHDLDAFRCIFLPDSDRRSMWYRAIARRLLRGLRRAAVVFYNSEAVGSELERLGVVAPERLIQAPLGVAPEFTPLAEGWRARAEPLYVLHVGSCIPRKRVDVLLDLFAELRRTHPKLELVHAGGEWTEAHLAQMRRLGIIDAIRSVSNISRDALADLYRGASLVVVPSESEGFGLPVIEALACGAAVLASDIPVLREVGGDAVDFRPVGDVRAWAACARQLLDRPETAPDARARAQSAARYTWSAHVDAIAKGYARVLEQARYSR